MSPRHPIVFALALSVAPIVSAVAQTDWSKDKWELPQGDRWQLTLSSGQILYELRLLRLAGDTIVFRQDSTTVSVPLAQLSELRLVQSSTSRAGMVGGMRGSLVGADDDVYQLTLYTVPEKRQILEQVLQQYPPEPAAADSTPPR